MVDDASKDKEADRRPFEDLEDIPVIPESEETVLQDPDPPKPAPRPSAPPPGAPAAPSAPAKTPTGATPRPAAPATAARTPTAAVARTPSAAPASPVAMAPTGGIARTPTGATARPPTGATARPPAAPPAGAARTPTGATARPAPPDALEEKKRIPSGVEIQAALDAIGDEQIETIQEEEPAPERAKPLRELRRPSREGRAVEASEPGEWTDQDTYVFRHAGLVTHRGPMPILFGLATLVVLAWAGLYGWFFWNGDRPMPDLAEIGAVFGGAKK